MTRMFQRRTTRHGFTLIEMVITMVLMAILMSVAFVGFTAVARRTASLSIDADIDVIHSAQLRFAAVHGSYTPWPEDLTSVPLGVSATAGPSTAVGQVSVAVGVDGTLALSSLDAENNCRAVQYPAHGVGGEAIDVTIASTSPCEARSALPAGEASLPAASIAGNLIGW